MEDKSKMQGENSSSTDLVLDLNFVPQWARKPPGESHYAHKEYAEEADEGKERRERSRTSRPERHRDDRIRPPRRDSKDQHERSRPPPEREPIEELPIDVSFLPEQKRLASLVRQIHHSRRAYPLMDLASLLISDPEGYLVKIDADKEFKLFQCKQCKTVSRSEEDLRLHILGKHLTDFYEEEEILGDPPSGSFPGVARCRITGILLGPPNHHSYVEKLNELYQTRFSNIPLEEYKRNIEVLKDEELIEQWKEESRKQVVYRLKSDPEAAPIDRRRAELAFTETIGGLIETVHRGVMPARMAQQLKDRSLKHAIHRAWSKENRFPLTMSFAMRAAFRHMHLHMFKAGKISFVTHIKPHPVRPEDTVPNIAEVLIFLEQNPGSTRQHVLEVLYPKFDPKSKEAMEALQPLSWLIERGHIIEFFNGTLSIPLGRRVKV